MDFGRQRGFLLDGEDPPEKVGCRKESYLEFMYVDVSRDFVGVVSFLMVPRALITTGTVVVLSPHIRSSSLNLDFQVFVFV